MKQCDQCDQLLSEIITTCPSCGSEVAEGIQSIDNYRIVSILHEGYSSVVCHAIDEETEEDVAIRIFTPQSGVDDKIAARLTTELEILKELPTDYFVQHLKIKQSENGLWYRVSEWIDTKNWSQLFTSDYFNDYRAVFNLFRRIASILDGLHQIGHFIPHLILNDVIVFEKAPTEAIDRRTLPTIDLVDQSVDRVDIYASELDRSASIVLEGDEPSLGLVAEGVVELQVNGEAKQRIAAGGTFSLSGADSSATIVNVSSEVGARVITFRLR